MNILFQESMPARRLRSRSYRRLQRKVPGGSTRLHYERKKPKAARCGNCGAVLKGIPRELPIKFKGMSKSQKRPERPYGGVLCSRCMRQTIVQKFRAEIA